MTLSPRTALLGLAFCLTSPSLALACQGSLHIEIEHSGVYALDYATAIARQPQLAACRSDELKLTASGAEVPIRVVDGGDGQFGAGDRIEWVANQLHGPQSWFNTFSINNVYQLTVKPGPHARIRDAAATGSGTARLQRTLHFEQENFMIRLDQNQQKAGEEPDVWQWAKITHADPKPFEFSIDLPDLRRLHPQPPSRSTCAAVAGAGARRS